MQNNKYAPPQTDEDSLGPEELLSACYSYIESMNREKLIEYTKSFFELKHRAEDLSKVLNSDDKLQIESYLKLNTLKNAAQRHESFLGNIDYLTLLLKHFSELLRVEKDVMSELAQDDPGVYAKVLSYRRKLLGQKKQFGCYTSNLLSEYLSGERKRFNRDHTHWFIVCESGSLEGRNTRISSPLPQLKILSAKET